MAKLNWKSVLRTFAAPYGAKGIGAGIGAVTFGPQGAIAGWQIGAQIDKKLGSNEEDDPGINQLENINVQQATYGRAIPKVYGTFRLAGNIIWTSTIRAEWNGNDYDYFIDFAVQICDGPIQSIFRVWADDKFMGSVELPQDSTGYDLWETPFSLEGFVYYKGTETQLPDSTIQGHEGADIPAFRGTAYGVFTNFPLHEWGNNVPQWTFEVTKSSEEGHRSEPFDNVVGVPQDLAQLGVPTCGPFIQDGLPENIIDGDTGTDCHTHDGIDEYEDYYGVNMAYSGATLPPGVFFDDATPISDGASITHGSLSMLNDLLITDYCRVEAGGYFGIAWTPSRYSPVISGAIGIRDIHYRSPNGRPLPGLAPLSIWAWTQSIGWIEKTGWPSYLQRPILVEGDWMRYRVKTSTGADTTFNCDKFYLIPTDGSAMECAEIHIFNAIPAGIGGCWAGIYWWPDVPLQWDRAYAYCSLGPPSLTSAMLGYWDGRAWRSAPDTSFTLSPGEWSSEIDVHGPRTTYGCRADFANTSTDHTIAEFRVFNGPPDDVSLVWAADDNIVLYDNGQFVLIENAAKWGRINLSVDPEFALDVQMDYYESGYEKIPDGSDFDIDERGLVYTTWRADATNSVVVVLNGDTLEKQAWSTWFLPKCSLVRVSKETLHPYAVYVAADGSAAYVTDRNTFSWGAQSYYEITPPAGRYIKSVHLAGGGRILFIFRDETSGGTDNSLVQYTHETGTLNFSVITEELVGSSAFADPEIVTVNDLTQQVLVGSYDANGGGGNESIGIFLQAQFPIPSFDLQDIVSGNLLGPYPKSAWQCGPRNGLLVYTYDTNTVYGFNVASKTIELTATIDTSGTDPDQWAGGCVYHQSSRSIITGCVWGDTVYCRVFFGRINPLKITLDEVVSDICDQVGLSASEIDVTDLATTELWGFIILNRGPARDAIELLMNKYFFDPVDTDGKLYFISRGGSSIVTIPEEDLGAYLDGDAVPQLLPLSRQPETELPIAIEVTYPDYQNIYELGTQRATRQVPNSQEIVGVNEPVSQTATEARQSAEKKLAVMWLQRNRYPVSLGREYAWLNPADVITLQKDAEDYVVRVESMQDRGGIIDMEVVDEDADAYSSGAVATQPTPPQQQRFATGPTDLTVLDIPMFNPLNDQPGYYVALRGSSTAWSGGTLHESRSDGVSWKSLYTHTEEAIVGRAISVLAAPNDVWLFDRGNTVDVRLINPDDALTASTETLLLSGANLALLGDEIIQFASIEVLTGWTTNGAYRLSDLLRGRYGTEWAVDTHVKGERFVILDGDALHFQPASAEDLGVAMKLTAASLRQKISRAHAQDFTPAFAVLKPYAPCHIKGTRDGSNNLTITWIRRTRTDGEWYDEIDAPLGEDSEAYEVDIYDGSTVVRTISVTSQTASYTAAQQSTDGLTPGDDVDLIIYQISATVGRGFGAGATV